MARKAHYLSKKYVMEKVDMDAGYYNFVYAFNQLPNVSCTYNDTTEQYRVCADKDANLDKLIEDAYDIIYSKGWC